MTEETRAAPRIEDVVAVPGDAPGRRHRPQPLLAPPAGICRVGLVLDDGSVAWGDCIAATRVNPMLPDRPFLPANAVNTIQTHVRPALVGKRVSDFWQLAAAVDVLMEKKTVTRQVSASSGKGSPKQAPRPLTRRQLLTGKFPAPEPPAPRTVTVPVEQLIHPAIRYGVSHALLQAAAGSSGGPLPDFLARSLAAPEIDDSPRPVPLLGETHGRQAVVDRLIQLRVAALGYRVLGADPMVELGSQLDDWLAYVVSACRGEREAGGQPYRPALHLAVNGGLGQRHGNRPAQLLAGVKELLTRCGDHRLIIETPFLTGRLPAQIELLGEFRALCRQRDVPVALAASAWVNGVSALKAILAADVVDQVTIVPARFGSLHQTAAALAQCRQAGVPGLLLGSDGETPATARLLTALALVLRPALLAGMPDLGGANGVILAGNEMKGFLAEMDPALGLARR